MFLYSGTPVPSIETVVRLIAVHKTGRSIGNEITVKSELPLPALETIAPRIVVTEAMAIAPEITVRINEIK